MSGPLADWEMDTEPIPDASQQNPPTNPYSATGDWQTWSQWQGLWDAMRNGRDPRQALSDILVGFQGGNQRDLGYFLDHPAWRHMMAFSLKDSDAWKRLNAMSGDQLISSGMGQIGAQGQAAVREGLQSLGQSGLGRSAGARAAIERQARVGTGQAAANLTSQVYGAELQRLGMLANLEQQMQQLALGQGFNPRQTQGGSPTSGDWLSMVGALAGAAAAICWVAREVYGANNPRWLLFREWLLLRAPAWFRKIYLRYGQRIARALRGMPFLKPIVRRWMDRRIETMLWTTI